MPATIKDIAKRLNISVSTVSYALNGGPRTVPDDVKNAVMAVAREMNYRPNRLARSMVTGKTNTVGVVFTGAGNNFFLAPYVIHSLTGIANATSTRKQDILVVTGFREDHPSELVDHLLGGRVDGALFIATLFPSAVLEYLRDHGLPIVQIAGSPIEGIVNFAIDNESGVRRAMRYLMDLGHRRIAHIAGTPNMHDAQMRARVYRGCMLEAGLDVPEGYLQVGEFLIDGGYGSMQRLMSLPEPPTAVFCGNDEMAIGALRFCLAHEIAVPDRVSLVGFDASANSSVVTPQITTIRQPVTEMAAGAVEALLSLIEGQPIKDVVYPTELIVRASTSRPMEDRIS